MSTIHCPDCDVQLEPVDFRMGDAWNPHIKTDEERDDLLGALGINESRDVETYLCPECALLRFYAPE